MSPSTRTEGPGLRIMIIEVGHVEAIFRYPVKSMAGDRLELTNLGWHGIDGDRRLALRRVGKQTGFPWLTASTLPDLLRFAPVTPHDEGDAGIPTHVRTPEGKEMAVFGDELAGDIERRHGAPVQMTHLRGGIFDDASVSVITTDTVEEIGREAGTEADVRRFRPNIVVRLLHASTFQEDAWVGGVLLFGDRNGGPRVSVTTNDIRCSMINLDPDSAHSTPALLKAVVRRNQNRAGVYGTVVRTGGVAVGQLVRLQRATDDEPV